MSGGDTDVQGAQRQEVAIGVDIGGTRCRAAVVDGTGTLQAFADAQTPDAGDPARLGAGVAALVADVRKQAGVNDDLPIGIGLPGVVDRETGVMQRAVNLPALESVNVRELFEQSLGRTPQLETDVNAAGWAQYQRLDAAPARFIYLSIGTGVGGCVILNGVIQRHTRGGAGHFGHLIVDTSGSAPLCRCGASGCLEAVIDGGIRGGWHRGEQSFTAHPVAATLAQALLQVSHIYAPLHVALGGGVVDHNPTLVHATRAAFEELRSSLVPDELVIERAPLRSNDAGVIGAALLALSAT